MTPWSCWMAAGAFVGYRAVALVEGVLMALRDMDDDPQHLDDDDEMVA